MWVEFDSVMFEPNLVSKKGKPYSAWVMKGTKKIYGDAPDEEYRRIFFDNSTVTILEKGVSRPNINVVSYLKHLKKGEVIEMKFVRAGDAQELDTIQKIADKSDTGVEYTPLSDSEAERQATATEGVETPPMPAGYGDEDSISA